MIKCTIRVTKISLHCVILKELFFLTSKKCCAASESTKLWCIFFCNIAKRSIGEENNISLGEEDSKSLFS